MTASEPPGEQPPGDDTALLTAALNHTWAWYDAQVSRSLQVINYSLIAGAVLATAYVSAINGKHYPLAAVVAVAGAGVTMVAFLMMFRQILEVDSAEPVLAKLQDRGVGIGLAGTTRTERWIVRVARGRVPGMIALVAALLVDIGALLYAVIR
jgi:hypothetical protein